MKFTINDWNFDVKDEILQKIKFAYQNEVILPEKKNTFLAFKSSTFKKTKVVILGQDPYPNQKDAMGLAFSVNRDYSLPKSLVNIYKELEADLGIKRKSGNLLSWAKQGVLLLNTTLIVKKGHPGSYAGYGFEAITMQAIKQLNKKGNVCYILLGKHAQQFQKYILPNNHIIMAPHPSPLSAYRGFFGSKIFSKANEYLKRTKQDIINWED